MSAIDKALAGARRSLDCCKAAVASTPTETLLANGPSGVQNFRSDLSNSAEQLRHFKGWVYSAVRPIAQRIAGQPIHVGRAKSVGKIGTKAPDDITPLDNHELVKLFSDPNGLMVAWSLMFTTVASLELTGRQLWYLPDRKQILPIPTPWIKAFNGAARITSFTVQPPYTGEQIELDADECVLFAYPNPGDPHGAWSPLQAVGAEVDASEAIVTSQALMFRRGINPSHAIIIGKDGESKLRPRLNQAQQRQIVEAIRKRYGGYWNHGDPLILDALIEDIKPLSLNPKEMDYLKSGDAAKARVMQGFGTNPIISGQVEGSNRASSDAADRHFVQYVVNPKIELMSQTMTSWLRYVYGDESLTVWIEPCVANDAETSLKWAELLVQSKSITKDELRVLTPFGLDVDKFGDELVAGATAPQPPQPTNGKPTDEAEAKMLKASLSMIDKTIKFLSLPVDDAADRILKDV